MKAFTIFVVFVAIFATINSFAEDISVVDVKRNITMSDDDNIYKDFYINAGDGSALRKNMVVTVKRKVSIKDAGTKAIGDFDAVVGQLKVILVGNKVSVAREFKLLPRDEAPMLEQSGIMTGDKIDLANSFIDNSKPNYKHKSSENESPKEEKTASAAPTPLVAPATTTPAPATTQEREPAAASTSTQPLQKAIDVPVL